MSKSEQLDYKSWIPNLVGSVDSKTYRQISKEMNRLTRGVFDQPETGRSVAELLTFVELAAALHLGELGRRGLLPNGFTLPELIISYFNFIGAYYPVTHVIGFDVLALESLASDDLDRKLTLGTPFGQIKEIMTPRIFITLLSIEEHDHSCTVKRFRRVFPKDRWRYRARYLSDHQEYTAAGWQIYHAKKLGMPPEIIRQLVTGLKGAIRYRRNHNLHLNPYGLERS